MKIANEFTVSVPIERAWEVLTDMEQVIPLMPGAQLVGHEGDDFLGKVKVKVGPVTSEFSGKAHFVERDETAHRALIDGRGKEARGTGNAAATVVLQLHEAGDRTRVTVDTDLKVVGKLAQFGSGMLQQVSEKLLGQFVDSLEAKLAEGKAPAAPAEPAAAAPAALLPEIVGVQWNTAAGWAIGPEALIGWRSIDPSLPIDGVLTQAGLDSADRLAQECIEPAALEGYLRTDLGQDFFSVDPSDAPGWREIIADQSPPPMPADMPVFIGQGTADEVVPSESVQKLVDKLKTQKHITIHHETIPGANHFFQNEMDLLMGQFADAEIGTLTESELDDFEALIEVPDRDLFSWITGTEEAPSNYDTALFRRLKVFHTQMLSRRVWIAQ